MIKIQKVARCQQEDGGTPNSRLREGARKVVIKPPMPYRKLYLHLTTPHETSNTYNPYPFRT